MIRDNRESFADWYWGANENAERVAFMNGDVPPICEFSWSAWNAGREFEREECAMTAEREFNDLRDRQDRYRLDSRIQPINYYENQVVSSIRGRS